MAQRGQRLTFGAAWGAEEIGDQKADSVELSDHE